MRVRSLAVLALFLTGVIVLSATRGQESRTPPSTPPVVPATYQEAAPPKPAPALPVPTPSRDLSKLTEEQKQALLAAQRGAMWLFNMNERSGHFYYGVITALRRPIEGDNYLHQAAAAAILARAARITGDKRFEVRAAQAILLLMAETVADPKDAQVRYTKEPSLARNRVATAGLLVTAIHELPAPQADLLEKSDQLCNYVRRQARPNGSLDLTDGGDDAKRGDAAEAMSEYPGLALYGLMLSERQRPADWKMDIVRKAVAYYFPLWQANKNPACIPTQTAAYTEAYLLTKERAFKDCVLEMNNWLCRLQYDVPPRVTWWYGGFKGWKGGREVEETPTANNAVYGESLVNACRVAGEAGELDPFKRFSAAVERHLLFLSGLQYTLANTSQFAAEYRDELTGGFYASQQDGNLRLDYTQQAVAALLQYVEQVH